MAKGISEAALRRWMQDMGPRLIALSTGICRDRHQAEEIVQEAFVKLWKQPPDAGEVAYPSWLRRVVTNLSINALQRTKRPNALPEYGTDRSLQREDPPGGAMESNEEVERLKRAMDRLDPTKRAMLMLRAFEELSYEEIAQHLGIPIGTVMSRLNRARLALMEELEKDERGEGEGDDEGEGEGERGAQVYPFRKLA